MNDKERILSVIISTILLNKDKIPRISFSSKKNFTKDNILVAMSPNTNNFTVSIFDHYDTELGCVVVKDIVTGKLCNYFNEMFVELPREWFGKYTFLTGKKYKILCACEKYRIHSLDFDDINKTFTLKDRLAFHEEPYSQITISTKLSLKEIEKQLEEGNWIEL